MFLKLFFDAKKYFLSKNKKIEKLTNWAHSQQKKIEQKI